MERCRRITWLTRRNAAIKVRVSIPILKCRFIANVAQDNILRYGFLTEIFHDLLMQCLRVHLRYGDQLIAPSCAGNDLQP
jgi:hypothetical protein